MFTYNARALNIFNFASQKVATKTEVRPSRLKSCSFLDSMVRSYLRHGPTEVSHAIQTWRALSNMDARLLV